MSEFATATAETVIRDLGNYVKEGRKQTEIVRYILPFLFVARLEQKLESSRKKLLQALEEDEWNVDALLADKMETTLDARDAKQITGQHFFHARDFSLSDVVDAT